MLLPSIKLAEKNIVTEYPAFIMGILNVSGNSFWRGSDHGGQSVEEAVDVALRMVEDGADIIDIGGETTKPGSGYIDEKEELSRVIPLVKEIRKKTKIPLSIDTRKSSVMRAALDEGADILNDVSAMEDDPYMARLVSERRIPVVLMHKRGLPSDMQKCTVYDDIVNEVSDYLSERALFACEAGIEADKIILDYGVGFGKDVAGNLSLIKNGKNISDVVCKKLMDKGFDCKFLHVLAGLSRKSFIGSITGRDVEDRLYGTIAADLLAVQYGASVLRVHDVAAAKDSLAVYRSIA
ncbi:MAG: dihydropteroate synthase [Treponemataceae bacterium]|nr:dihydropteroate synthase [Treponemataceae bacterium]